MPINVECNDGVVVEIPAAFAEKSVLCKSLSTVCEADKDPASKSAVKAPLVASHVLRTLVTLEPDPRAIYTALGTTATMYFCLDLITAAMFFDEPTLLDALGHFFMLAFARGHTAESIRAMYAALHEVEVTEQECAAIRVALGCPAE